MFVVLHGIVALGGQDEVGRDQLRALMQELVERVLCVRGGLAEQDSTCGVLDIVTASRDRLAVRFH